MKDIQQWNKLLYQDSKDGKGWGAKEFLDELQLESWPLFKDKCAYHIPYKWTQEVKSLVQNIRELFGDQVVFKQIKEKFAWLTVYYDCPEELRPEVQRAISYAQDNLRAQGWHP